MAERDNTKLFLISEVLQNPDFFWLKIQNFTLVSKEEASKLNNVRYFTFVFVFFQDAGKQNKKSKFSFCVIISLQVTSGVTVHPAIFEVLEKIIKCSLGKNSLVEKRKSPKYLSFFVFFCFV